MLKELLDRLEQEPDLTYCVREAIRLCRAGTGADRLDFELWHHPHLHKYREELKPWLKQLHTLH